MGENCDDDSGKENGKMDVPLFLTRYIFSCKNREEWFCEYESNDPEKTKKTSKWKTNQGEREENGRNRDEN